MPGEITISVPERILLHLVKVRSDGIGPNAPREATQDGIGDAVGAYRSYVSTSLKTLLAEGLVAPRLAHVPGHKRRVKAYALTASGLLRARGLREALAPALPDDGAIAEALRSYAQQKPPPRRVNADVRLSGHSSTVPVVKHFFGRKRELRAVQEFLAAPDATVLILKGIAGMGKTTLLAKALELSRAEVVWHRFYEWSTLRGLAQRLGGALATAGRTRFRESITRREILRVEEMAEAIRGDLEGTRIVIVLDDYHNADTETQRFVKALRWAMHGSGAKLCVAGRAVAPFYDRAEVGVSRSVREIRLEGLDPDAGVAMLGSRNIVERDAREIHRLVAGHPLSLELVRDPGDLRAGGDAGRFVREEIFDRLPAAERDLLKRLCVHRRPVEARAVAGPGDVELLDSLEERGFLRREREPQGRGGRAATEVVHVHELLREFCLTRLARDELRDAHLAAAGHYASLGGDLALLEQTFHLLLADRKEEAGKLLIANGSRILGQGFHEELNRLLDEFSPRSVPEGVWLGLAVLRGEILELRGEWDLARKSCEDCLAMARRKGSEREIAALTQKLGVLHYRKGELTPAAELVETAARMHESLGDDRALCSALSALGVIAWKGRRFDEALANYERSLSMARRSGDREGEARALNNLGIIHLEKGDHRASAGLFGKALEIYESLGDKRTLSILYGNLGDAARLSGSPDARKFYERSRELAESLSFAEQLAEIHLSMAAASVGEERVDNLHRAMELFRRLGAREGVARVEAALKPAR